MILINFLEAVETNLARVTQIFALADRQRGCVRNNRQIGVAANVPGRMLKRAQLSEAERRLMLAEELCLDGPIFAAPSARNQVDAFVTNRQLEFLANLRRNVAQQSDISEYRPIFCRGLQIKLHEPLEVVTLVSLRERLRPPVEFIPA
jgi:hypothetical protein